MNVFGTAILAGTVATLWVSSEVGLSQTPAERASSPGKTTNQTSGGQSAIPHSKKGRAAKTKAPGTAGQLIQNDLVRHIIGMSVENQDGERLGRIKDFVADTQSGQVRYAIVSTGGILLGVGSHLKVLPARALSMATAKKDTVALELSKSRWAKAPNFKRSQLASLADPARMQQIYQFYGQSPAGLDGARAGGAVATPVAPGPKGSKAAPARRAPASAGTLALASEVIGRRVINRQQERLGVVWDLLVDMAGQKPAFAIILAGRFLKREQTFAVPLQALSLLAGDSVTLDAHRGAFEQAQPFDGSVWKMVSSRAEAIYRFEAREP